MKPIYKPKGAAAEYCNYAVNIYNGCPHRCYYCFAPQVLHRDREAFHKCVEPRKNIVEELRRQLEREKITGELIHLCFTCDPYPMTSADANETTREVIQALKEYGNHVQILTKGTGRRDFDLLDSGDWYGVTISCGDLIAKAAEPFAASPSRRMADLEVAKLNGIRTWVSFEPVVEPDDVMECISGCSYFIDKAYIGKLNYWPSDIQWKQFGQDVEELCRKMDLDYCIKDSLRAEMDKA